MSQIRRAAAAPAGPSPAAAGAGSRAPSLGAELGDAAARVFCRHQTFPPRYGWLGNGFAAAAADPRAFSSSGVAVTLGVGKNMAAAIRYWLRAFKLTAEHRVAGVGTVTVPAQRGRWLLGSGGADPWLEDPASLWLLNWWLLSPRCEAPTWWAAFHLLPSTHFREAQLTATVIEHARGAGWPSPSPAAIGRDIACLTRMYAGAEPVAGRPGSYEDSLLSQFGQLRLLHREPPGTGYDWRLAAQVRPPAQLVAYACLDHASWRSRAAGTASLARLAADPGSPGRAFLLGEDDLAGVLREAAAVVPHFSVIDSAGQRILSWDTDPRRAARASLDAYYQLARSGGRAPEMP